MGGEGKGGKYLEKENIFFSVEEKIGEEKCGKYLVDGVEEKGDGKGGIFFVEGTYTYTYTYFGGEEKQRRKKRTIFGEGKYLEKENIFRGEGNI